jgi:hypothetical protein
MPIQISKDVIARRNQDKTVIVMRLDESSVFYKISGIAAQAWSELTAAKTYAELLQLLKNDHSDWAEEIERDLPKFISELIGKNLLTNSGEIIPSAAASAADNKDFNFGGLKEFNLEQIESEVLNESAYLDVFAGSDLRLKTDISELSNTLEKLQNLDAILYKWDPETVSGVNHSAQQVGLVAQQVAEVFPELVKRDSETNRLAVNYTKLSAHLVVAVKELTEIINRQDERIADLERSLKKS